MDKSTCNYYELLGAAEQFSREELTAAYHQRCLECHPDKCDIKSKDDFILVQEAYSILNDPILRIKYDKWLRCGVNVPFDLWSCKSTVMHWCDEPPLPPLTGHVAVDVTAEDTMFVDQTDKDTKSSTLHEKFRNYEI